MAVGFGLKAIERGYRVLFTTAAAMLTTLTKALSEGRFDDKLKIYTIPRLLIIDEIGYLPIDRQAATLFFQLISRRYQPVAKVGLGLDGSNCALGAALFRRRSRNVQEGLRAAGEELLDPTKAG